MKAAPSSKDVVLRGDKQCPHGHTRRRKCDICDREDDQKEIEKLRRLCYTAADFIQDNAALREELVAASGEPTLEIRPVETTEPIPHHIRFDRLGWMCSICAGWNDAQHVHCIHPHVAKPHADTPMRPEEPEERQLTDAENEAMDRDMMKAIKRDAVKARACIYKYGCTKPEYKAGLCETHYLECVK
jgi:hypothetical protein